MAISDLKTLPIQPGVYQFFDAQEKVIYVGKARNLKRRVSSYFQRNIIDSKTAHMREQIAHIELTVTNSENEALILEATLIKKLRPRYNVLLKDDKSYPYLFLGMTSDFPRLDLHRGTKRAKGRYFGPYPNAGAVRETLNLLQKLFQLRQCSDSFFRSRTRPCLQYQIKRCTAPCVDYISKEDYKKQVQLAILFLEGKSNSIINQLVKKMESAAQARAYEEAARLRDQIAKLRHIQEQQYVSRESKGVDVDIIAVEQGLGCLCIQLLFIRAGRLIGSKAYFPKAPSGATKDEILSAFLPQYYLDAVRGEGFPKKIVLSTLLSDQKWIEAALTEGLGKKIELSHHVRGKNRRWLLMTIKNAKHSLAMHLSDKASYTQRLEALQRILKLPNLPQRMECFDVSHTMGEATVASCVVFDEEGPAKKYYRRFNITDIAKGDDYAAMYQALVRRYTRIKSGNGSLPDLLIIDGGKGQLTQAEKALEEVQVSGVYILAIAKGPERKPGLEVLFLSGRKAPIELPPDSVALHLVQHIRDEAHRFAIMAHRKKRAQARVHSRLEDIPGIGAKRRRELLRQFGGLQELKRASAEDIAKVPGISHALAQKIYDVLQAM